MNLNKKKLINELERGLTKQGFVEFKETFLGADGFFVKKIQPNLYLSLGLVISRFEKENFTGSFYLSKTTCWSCTWGDIPKNSYQRIGFLLNDRKKTSLLGADYEVVEDNWWNATSPNAFDNFINAVQVAEINFITPELIQDIEKSSDVTNLYELASKVITKIKEKKDNEDLEFQFTPLKEVDNVPRVWFQKAEIILKENKQIVNQNKVRLLASDAYRIYSLNN